MTKKEKSIVEKQTEALLRLMQDKDCFDKLLRWTERVNIFEVLKIVRTEIRHSNMLAWLLDPNESHGMGSDFLYSFITDLSKHHSYEFVDNDIEQIIGIDDAIKLLSSDLTNSQVFREWNHIDILILLPNQYIIAIENKVDANESKNQLQQYKEKLDKYYPFDNGNGFKHIKIFLTPNGDKPSENNNDWKVYTYSDILSILKQIYESHKNHLSLEANILIDNYIKILDNDIMDNQELKNLCNEIYNKHKQALDLIFEHKESVTSLASDACHNTLVSIANENNITINKDKKPGVYIQFITPMIQKMKQELNDDSIEVYYQFEFKPNQDFGCNAWLKLVIHNTSNSFNQETANVINKYAEKNKFKNNNSKEWKWKHIWGTKVQSFAEIIDTDIEEWVEKSIKSMRKYEQNIE